VDQAEGLGNESGEYTLLRESCNRATCPSGQLSDSHHLYLL